MIEELKDDELIKKAGGRFRLSSLIRQRLVALSNGSTPYVDVPEGTSDLEVVIREIMEEKIFLDMNAKLVKADISYLSASQVPASSVAPSFDFPELGSATLE